MAPHLPYDRASRVADEIYHIVAGAVISDLTDPRIAGATVTRVRMTKDLRVAYVYFHLKADEAQREAAVKGFKSSVGYLKRRIGDEIKLKFMPEIQFFYDEAVDVEERIDDLLKGDAHKA